MAITKAGESQSFDYTGSIQKFTVPFTGIYKLEVYGAKGGAGLLGETGGAAGGYSVGYTKLTAGDTLYVAVGGAGANTGHGSSTAGGWNGGGNAGTYYGGGGGGATHIALNSNRGELKNYANYKSEVLIVAGGGGGSCQGTLAYNYEGKWYSYAINAFGGTGGGTSGGPGTYVVNHNGYNNGGTHANGGQVSGSQTAAGYNAGFGYGGNAVANANGGGGGGWYGGGCGNISSANAGGGGGSGYIGNVPSFVYKGTTYAPSTENGKRNGNGTAIITYISKTTLFYFNGNEVTDLIYNGTNITSLTFDGTKLF